MLLSLLFIKYKELRIQCLFSVKGAEGMNTLKSYINLYLKNSLKVLKSLSAIS